MKIIAAAIALFCALLVPAAAADLSMVDTETLVDRLVEIDGPAPGLSGGGIYSAFLAVDGSTSFEAGLLGAQQPAVPDTMKELTRRGVAALPVLLVHLDDARPTKFAIQRSFLQVLLFGEYDPRDRTTRIAPTRSLEGKKAVPAQPASDSIRMEINSLQSFSFVKKPNCTGSNCLEYDPDIKFRVKVGDVCLVLVGQIVGRNLNAVRYQPSGILVINSPIFTPSLAARTRADWSGLTADGLKNSLLRDIDANANRYVLDSAFIRLKYYFPQVYDELSGRQLEKKEAFEKDLATRK